MTPKKLPFGSNAGSSVPLIARRVLSIVGFFPVIAP
jgi:hypothetical protein